MADPATVGFLGIILCWRRKTTKIVSNESYGPCLQDKCDGKVDLVEYRTKSSIWFVPVGKPTTTEMARCQKCGHAIKATQYKLKMKYEAKGRVEPKAGPGKDDTLPEAKAELMKEGKV
uniref:Uncharacterized protein n=1 Tax=Helicotheca tamesis TaxID=374047 RepID=A0A7S2IFJ4_9STRA